MLVIGDPLDPPVRSDIEPNDSLYFPRAILGLRRMIEGSPSTSPSVSRHVTRIR